ncbi:hypothetical protein IM538_07735 [Cytobacillus suaedae]|nr:hypothetical protein IM538_07735 [Cytobacillus suaedae]
MGRKRKRKQRKDKLCQLLASLPPNYTLGTVYLKGQPVTVTNFSNNGGDLSFFIADGAVTVLDCRHIHGLGFAPAEVEEPIEEEEEEEAE